MTEEILPSSLSAALEIAGEINPRLLAQAFVEVAANSTIGVIWWLLMSAAPASSAMAMESRRGRDAVARPPASAVPRPRHWRATARMTRYSSSAIDCGEK